MDIPELLEPLEPIEELEISNKEDEISKDIKMLGEKYRETLLFFERFYRDAAIPVVILNDSLNILWENDNFTNVIGYGELNVGTNLTSLFSTFRDKDTIRELFKNIRNSNQNYTWQGFLERKDFAHLRMLSKCLIFPISDMHDKIFYVAMFNDFTDENKKLLRSTYMSLLEASKMKDHDTGNHIQRVGQYSRAMAKYMYKKKLSDEIDVEFIDTIQFLAQMHDVGKIGTPDDILNKEGGLQDWEWKIMKEHTLNGAYILSSYPSPMAKQIALFHHERWNGEGYPYQLSGYDIPLAARICSIADVYDALRMKRSYKRAYRHKETIKKINSMSGINFDPLLVKVLNAIEKEFSKIFKSLID